MEKGIEEIYQELEKQYSNNLKNTRLKLRRLSIFRLLTFLLAIISPILLYQHYSLGAIFSSVLFMGSFLFLVKRYGKAEKSSRLLENYISLNNNELKALSFDFSPFSSGREHTDTEHEYTYDLDIFGEFSLFRFLNRTSTRTGDEQLASWLKQPLLKSKEISERQNAVKELASKLEWRQKLSAHGLLYRENNDDVDTIRNWGEAEIDFPGTRLYKLMGKILPALTLIILGFCIGGIISFNFIAVPVTLQVLLLAGRRKEVNFFFRTFGKRSEILSKYKELLEIIENETFNSELLKKWQKTLISDQATRNITLLKKEVNLFDARLNIYAGIILNTLFMWDINRCLALADWHKKNGRNLALWLRVLSKFDAIISIANYSFNYPSNVFPKLSEGQTGLKLTEGGHPLIPPSERVNNTFFLSGEGSFAIVTGANMAGKSTFLRSVGVNLILAMSGAPVCAKEFEFTPTPVFTHMRTDDNLSRHESYFFAELKRIKAILEKLNKNGSAFIILDEILRGTNSEDKLKGSVIYMEKLISSKGTGLVATHDLKLTELKEKYPDNIENVCFEIGMSAEGLEFDYKLSEGVTKTMNATFLMKQMGII